jgi:hypothetical protein
MCPQRRTPCLHRAPSRWLREMIRSARRVDLVELLAQRGLHLQSTGNGNYEVREHPGIIVKRSYWCWPERDISGNTIDFFVDVLGMSFNQAMEAILNSEGAVDVTIPCRGVAESEAGRSKRGNLVPDSDGSPATSPETARP